MIETKSTHGIVISPHPASRTWLTSWMTAMSNAIERVFKTSGARCEKCGTGNQRACWYVECPRHW